MLIWQCTVACRYTPAGADLGFIKGGANSRYQPLGYIEVCKAHFPARSMLELGGPGGMPPQEIFEK